MNKTILSFSFAVVLVFSSLFIGNIFAQTAPLQYYIQSYQFESQIYDGNGTVGSNPSEIIIGEIELHNIPWLQLHFSDVNLGNESYLIIRSLYDDKWQKLDAVSMKQWNNFSAFFNGNAVEIKLFLAQTDRQVYIKIDEIVVGEWFEGDPTESQCGPTDDRTASNQPATARLLSVGCTAWIIPNGKFATAGHCLDGSSSTVVEFNVPLSLPNGTLQHPGPEDQYSVNVSTKIFTNGGVGNDWGVFEVFPNSITGLMPKQAQNAYWPLVQDLGPDSIRITGYGVDDGTANQTQQTHIGPNAGSSGTTMRYVTDTEGGNSGSPVIDGLTNVAVGVHTHGGCTSSGGNNNGTSLFHTAFWAAVDQGAGGCPVEPPTDPSPPNGTTGVPLNLAQLTWLNGMGAVTNELYFGTNPSSLNLVQSGTLATSWTITGVTFTYGTTYYWRVVEIGDTCSTNGPVWSFTTVQDPNLVQWCDAFTNMNNWTIVGPLGTTNWSANNSGSAGGTAPELRLTWTPSFTGVSKIRSVVIPLPDNQSMTYSFNYYFDWYANPSGTITVGVTYDGGATSTILYNQPDATGNIGPIVMSGNFTTPASGAANTQIEITYNGYSFNYDNVYWDNMCLEYVVPVELAAFTVNALGADVELIWTTATETNNKGFEVERITSSGDFEMIGFVPGYGTTTEPKSYSYTDSKPGSGNYSYRLKQIDYDGSFSYSNVIEVEVTAPSTFSLEQNYPNPFNPSTTIRFSIPVETDVRLNVYNTLGQEVAEILNGRLKEGYHEVDFDAVSLTSGIYFYRLEADKFVDVKKMIIIK
ncbi:MAG: T9SS type A sorting domain-containing protein [bacterium]|nr:T9SS type A sorting domain-containing protein [bacterium]